MNADQLREMMDARLPSRHVERMDVSALHCYGCAHSDAASPPPGRPSGERPCMACVRNPEKPWERESKWRKDATVVDDRGNARCFDAFAGTAYNGMPMVHHPMDRYVTMDSRDQEDWMEEHPDYGKPITFDAAGNPSLVEGE